jgi:hypothetical protein
MIKSLKKVRKVLSSNKHFRNLESNKKQLIVFPLVLGVIGIYLVVRSFAATPNALPGDINGDNTVSILDMSLLLSNYNKTKTQASNPNTDINNDNIVNVFDLSILLSNYGKTGTQVKLATPVLTLTPGDGQIKVTWNAISGAVGYQLAYRTTIAEQSNTTNVDLAATATSYTITGLTNGTTYYVSILSKATASANNSDWAPMSSATPTGQAAMYWGAFMDGKDTYDYHYPGQRPGGWFSSATEWGPAPWDAETHNKFESNSGKKATVVQFGISNSLIQGNDFNYWKGPIELIRQRGEIANLEVFTNNVPLRDIKAGSVYEAHITQWFQQAAAYGRPFYLALDPEMNGGWYNWSTLAGGSQNLNHNTPAEFVSMWRYLYNLSVQQGATNITWVWAPNVDNNNQFSPYSENYPGDAFVDWTGLRAWNKGTGGLSFDTLISISYNRLLQLSPNKPISLNTIGTTELGSINKVDWLNGMFASLPSKYPKIKNFIWFNWRTDVNDNGILSDSNDCICEIESSSTALQAWKTGMSSSYYLPGNTSLVNLPLKSKVPVP